MAVRKRNLDLSRTLVRRYHRLQEVGTLGCHKKDQEREPGVDIQANLQFARPEKAEMGQRPGSKSALDSSTLADRTFR